MAEQIAFGTTLSYGGTLVGNLIDVEWGGVKLEFKDTTNHGSTPAQWRTKRPVMASAEPCKAKVQMIATTVTGLLPLVDPTASASTWTIVYPSPLSKTATFSGWLSDYKVLSAEVDGILEVELEITPTGKPTLA